MEGEGKLKKVVEKSTPGGRSEQTIIYIGNAQGIGGNHGIQEPAIEPDIVENFIFQSK